MKRKALVSTVLVGILFMYTISASKELDQEITMVLSFIK